MFGIYSFEPNVYQRKLIIKKITVCNLCVKNLKGVYVLDRRVRLSLRPKSKARAWYKAHSKVNCFQEPNLGLTQQKQEKLCNG